MLFLKHPFFSAVMFLSLSATSSNANRNGTNRYPMPAPVPPPTASEVSIPQLPPSSFILVHDAKKILSLVVRSLPGRPETLRQSKITVGSTPSYHQYEAATEPTAVSDLHKAVGMVEKSALSEEDWRRIQRLIRNIIEEYGHPQHGVVENTQDQQAPAAAEVVKKRTPGQVMATYMAVSFVTYEAVSLLFF